MEKTEKVLNILISTAILGMLMGVIICGLVFAGLASWENLVKPALAERLVVTTEPAAPALPEPPAPAPSADEPTGPAPSAPSTRDLPPAPAGADFFALGVEDLGEGWLRVREAGNRDYCAWSNIFRLSVSPGVAIQIPHCLEWRMTGSGEVSVTFKPDPVGYATSDVLGTGLAWWPSGNAGDYQVIRGDESTGWVPLTTGPEGVNFPLNGGEVTLKFRLANGYVSMPLGEIRNNVFPVY